MNSQMHAHCAVPITPEGLTVPGLRPSRGLDSAALASDMSLPFDACMSRRDEEARWSARRTLTFIFVSNAVLWWVIAEALRSLA